METIKTYNGNEQEVIKELPKIEILAEYINDIALEHIKKNTGLGFIKGTWSTYSAQPENSSQIVALFLKWNLKTQYHDNLTIKNTILVKFCNDACFKLDRACVSCLNKSHIYTQNLKENDMLSV